MSAPFFQLNASPSEFVEAVLRLKGKPFSFEGYEFFRDIYDTDALSIVLKCARQVAKSTFLGNRLCTSSAERPHFQSLFVAPTENQITTFNKQKLDPTLIHSPDFRSVWFRKDITNQATFKQLSNGSSIILRSCFLTADSIRGISSDQVCLDEVQDILTDNIPVILECMTKSDYKYTLMAGTPKTNQHSIEFFWDKSTRYEWLVPCLSCNKWNLLGENNVRYEGLCCSACDAFLDASRGEWVATNPDRNATVAGYRIPQIMVPWIPWHGENSIWDKYLSYSKEKFYNEVLALPYDNASCPITVDQLMAICDPQLSMILSRGIGGKLDSMIITAGVDWGTGQDDGSYTLLVIGGFTPDGRFVQLFAKRYEGPEAEPEHAIKDIIKILKRFRIDLVGVDWGFGFGMNSRLMEFFPDKVVEFFNSDNQRQMMKYDKDGRRWTLSRTMVMSEMFSLMKTSNVILPKWEETKVFARDALNIFTDYMQRGGSTIMRYNHAPGKQDDWFLAIIYAYMASVVARGIKGL